MQYTCSFCPLKFRTIIKYEQHQYFHRRTNKNFQCKRDGCQAVCKHYNSFVSHINRSHPKQRITHALALNVTVKCTSENCCYVGNSFNEIKAHSYDHIKQGEYSMCPFQTVCKSSQVFKLQNNLRVHFCRKHNKNNLQFSQKASHSGICVNSENTVEMEDTDLPNEDKGEVDIENANDLCTLGINMFSNLYLNAESKYNLSKSSLQVLVSAMSDIGKLNNQYICEILNSNEIHFDKSLIAKDLFYLGNDAKQGIFRSNFTREKYYMESFNFVEPVKIELVSNTRK